MRALASLIGLSIALIPAVASADAKECIAASEAGQTARTALKLSSAKIAFAQCASDACPAVIRKDCASQLAEVDTAIPTMVFGAKVGGGDLAAARVLVDGTVVAERIDGRAVAFDPGSHLVRFEAKGQAPIEKTVILKQGEKNRVVEAELGTATTPPVAGVGAAPVTPEESPAPAGPPEEFGPSNGVRMNFGLANNSETWSLHAASGSLLCKLPCSRWVGVNSKYFVQKDELRSGGTPDRVDVPADLPYGVGASVNAKPKRDSVVGPALTLVASGLLLGAGAIYAATNAAGTRCTSVSAGGNCTLEAKTPVLGIIFMSVGGIGLLTGAAWLAWFRGHSLETGPGTTEPKTHATSAFFFSPSDMSVKF